jgi:hypothetical protein
MDRGTCPLSTCLILVIIFAVGGSPQLQAQEGKARYPSMAPLNEYLMPDRDAEIALARSAAPAAISSDATVLVFGRKGYETAVTGKNGFVCVVERSWTSLTDNDPEFWNPKDRFPICYNPPAARFLLPLTVNKTEMALAGQSQAQIIAGVKAFGKKELRPQEPGAMCYMMSSQGYLGDALGHGAPHLMFYVPQGTTWGGDAPGSPVLRGPQQFPGPPQPVSILVIMAPRWSDGTDVPKE